MNALEKVQNNETNDQGENNRPGLFKGLMIGLSILVMLAFWGGFAYAVWVQDMELVMTFVSIISVGAAVAGTIHFLSKLRQHLSKS